MKTLTIVYSLLWIGAVLNCIFSFIGGNIEAGLAWFIGSLLAFVCVVLMATRKK